MLAAEGAYRHFPLRGNNDRQRFTSLFWHPNPIAILLGKERGTEKRGAWFFWLWREIYKARLVGVGKGRSSRQGESEWK